MHAFAFLSRAPGAVVAVMLVAGGSCMLPAQSRVVPRTRATSDAPTLGWMPGLPIGLRQQFVIGASHLAGLSGKSITGVWLRRDASVQRALRGGVLDLEVRASTSTSLDPAAPSPRFADNHGRDLTIVYRGAVQVPNSPPVGPGYQPWAPANTVRLTFSRPLPYTAGSLCLELRGRARPGREPGFWVLDYERDGHTGRAAPIGAACGAIAFAGTAPASAWPATLRPGATAMLPTFARPHTTGMLLVSARLLNGAAGIPLARFGAPGCRLWVSGESAATVAFGAAEEPGAPAYDAARLQIPADRGLVGGRLFAQWVVLEWTLPRAIWTNALGATTTNAVDLTIGGAAGGLGLAVVERGMPGPTPPPRGDVRVGRGPVLALIAR